MKKRTLKVEFVVVTTICDLSNLIRRAAKHKEAAAGMQPGLLGFYTFSSKFPLNQGDSFT